MAAPYETRTSDREQARLRPILRVPLALLIGIALTAGGAYLVATDALQSSATEWRGRLREAQEQLEAHTAEREELAEQIESLEVVRTRLEAELSAAGVERERLATALEHAEAQRRRLEVALDELESRVRDLQEQVDEYRRREGTDRRVLFIGGMTSVPTTGEYPYVQLKQELIRRGWALEDLHAFSYRGGSLNGLGEYVAQSYDCADLRPWEGVAKLARYLEGYRQMRPDVSFTLVGHSYGGLVALRVLSMDDLPVRAVVAIDSPLNGISPGKAMAAQHVRAEQGFCAAADQVYHHLAYQQGDWPLTPGAEVGHARRKGIRIATVGNTQDCLYNPIACAEIRTRVEEQRTLGTGVALLGGVLGCLLGPWGCVLGSAGTAGAVSAQIPFDLGQALADESSTQVVPETDWSELRPLGGDIADSHSRWLTLPSTVAHLADFIGPPGQRARAR